MKLIKFLSLASLALVLASCNKEKEFSETGQEESVVAVSLQLGANTRAALTDLQDKVADNAAASVKKVHVYLTTAEGVVNEFKEFTPGTEEYTKLTSPNTLENKGGYKFLNVKAGTVKATVIVNPQGQVAKGKNINKLANKVLKAKVDEVLYAGTKNLETKEVEPWGVDPQNGQKTKVKTAEFELTANMNRFQVLSTKFYKISWKAGQKAAAEDWMKNWLKQPENTTKTSADAWTAFKKKELNGEVYNKTTNTVPTHWGKYFERVDITAENTGIFMNRFYNQFNSVTLNSDGELMNAVTYMGGIYDFTNGTFKPNGVTDLSEAVSYYRTSGFDFAATTATPKAAAFNFFSDKVTSYAADGDAPTLHFVFKTDKVDANHRFVNIKGYYSDIKSKIKKVLDAATNKGGKLINLDLAQVNDGAGILVTNDPDIPSDVVPTPDGGDDIVSQNMNVIIKVKVENWNAVNVYPIL